MTEPIPIRLCDDEGMVSDEPVAGFPASDPASVTYRQFLNNLRAQNGDPDKRAPYTGPPFPCTGSAHMAGQVFHCTSPAHVVMQPKHPSSGVTVLGVPLSWQSANLLVPFAGEGGSCCG